MLSVKQGQEKEYHPLLHVDVVAIEKGAFRPLSTIVDQNRFFGHQDLSGGLIAGSLGASPTQAESIAWRLGHL